MSLNIKHLNVRTALVLLAFIFLIFNNTIVFSQDNTPEFPYDPDEKATQAKICAKVCLKRRDACIKIEVENIRGVLAQLSSQIAHNECNIESVTYDDAKETGHNIMVFIISVSDNKALAKLMAKLKKNDTVLNIERKKS